MKSNVGRPIVLTKATVLKLEHAFRDGFSIEMACHLSGISRSTYYAHINDDLEFSNKMELAQQWVTQRAKKVLIQAIDKDDLKAAQWWLERKAKADFNTQPPPQQREYISKLHGIGDHDKFIKLMADTIAELEVNAIAEA